MGRVKLEIKKIENITNRQVTFSKRRNGLIKKAHELSVLCDVDVALIMFSPSGRLSLFSGNKRIEEVLERYFSLPEHERGRMNNKEFLQRALGKPRSNYEGHKPFQVSSPTTTDSQTEEVQQQFLQCKSQLEDMERKLRIFESDPGEITTLSEAQYCERILEETLEHVRLRKQALEEAAANEAQADSHPASQVYFPADDENVIALAAAAANAAGANNDNNNNVVDHYWIQQRDVDTPINILNLTDHPGDVILPLRGEASSHMAEMLSSPTVLLQRQILQQQLDDDNTNNVTTTSPITMMEEEESNVLDHHQQHFHEFGQHIHDHRHVNLPVPSSWNFHHFYPIGNNQDLTTTAQPTGTTLLELDLSQFTPP